MKNNFLHRLVFLSVFIGFLAILFPFQRACAQVNKQYKIAVVLDESRGFAREEWENTVDFLSRHIDRADFKILLVTYDQLLDLVSKRKVDFFICNPVQYIQAEILFGAERIATRKRGNEDIGSWPRYAGVIFTRSGRKDINRLKDLRGKRVSAVDRSSLAGWLAPLRELKKAGIDPEKDFAFLRFYEAKDEVVFSVKKGEADAGFVDSGRLEELARKGMIDPDDFRVIKIDWVDEPGFPFQYSTRVYPEWAFAKCKFTGREVAEKVARSLLSITPEDPAAVKGGYRGWTVPLNYEPVVECMKELRVAPFQDYGRITPAGIVKEYWPWLLVIAVLLLMMAGTIVSIGGLNRKLSVSENKLKEDIAVREKAEAAIRREKVFSDALISSLPGAFYVLDKYGNFVRFNKYMEDMTGLTASQITGKPGLIAIHVDDQELVRRKIAEVFERGFAEIEARGVPEGTDVPWFYFTGKRMDIDGSSFLVGTAVAITVRKRAQEALQENKARLDLALRSAGMGVWRWDIPENKRYFDDQAARLLGVDPYKSSWDEEEFFRAVYPEDHAVIKESVARTIEQDAPYEVDYRVVLPDKNLHYLSSRGRLVRDDSGRPVRINGVVWDITERKKIEDKLRSSEAQLANALKIARLGPWEYDVINDRFTFNDHFYAIFRTSAGQAGGYTMSSAEYAERFVHPEDRAIVGLEVRKTIEAGDDTFSRRLEHRVVYSDGGIGYITVLYFIVKDKNGKVIRSYGVNQDITERKKAEEELKSKTAFLEAQVEAGFDGLLVVDSEGKRILTNQRLVDAFKIPLSVIEDKDDEALIRHVLGKVRDPEQFLEKVKYLYSHQDEVLRDELEFSDGTVFDRYSAPVKDKAGRYFGRIWVFRDITERKRAEDELELAYEKLKETQDQLIQSSKMAAIGLLAGGVAHEINNPLTGVLNNVQLIKLEVDAGKESFTAEFLDILNAIEESALRCRKITLAMLDFTRVSKNAFQPLDCNAIIEKALEIVRPELDSAEVVVRKDQHPDLPVIQGDAQLLQQVILGLIANARWAIERRSGGGGTITIRTYAVPEIKNVIITVSDSGIGIPEENLAKVFEPFFTTKEAGEGTGLGLALIYNIVKNHRGNITVESRADEGTTFTLSLPYS